MEAETAAARRTAQLGRAQVAMAGRLQEAAAEADALQARLATVGRTADDGCLDRRLPEGLLE